jgi:polar amino acid transport system substrate-binding protein
VNGVVLTGYCPRGLYFISAPEVPRSQAPPLKGGFLGVKATALVIIAVLTLTRRTSMKRAVFFVITLAAMVFVLAGCNGGSSGGAVAQEDSIQRILKAGKLVIATELAGVPINFKDAQGNPTGLIVEMMELAGQELGVTLEWQDMAWESLIPSLTQGKVDMIAAHMSMTLSRHKTVRFSDPYMFTGVLVLARRDSNFTRWEQALEKKTLATTMGNSHSAYLVDKYNYEPKQYESMPEWLSELKSGRIDAVMDDELLLLEVVKQNPDLMVFPDIIRPDVYGLAFRQGVSEDTLVNWFNWFLTWEKLNGTYGEIYKKYIGKDLEPHPIIQ